jgi:hypothetical protein
MYMIYYWNSLFDSELKFFFRQISGSCGSYSAEGMIVTIPLGHCSREQQYAMAKAGAYTLRVSAILWNLNLIP